MFLLSLATQAAAQSAGSPESSLHVETTKNLDTSALVTLLPGDRFQISLPLRPSKAVNLGAARLDVTLMARGKGRQNDPVVHLIATMPSAQSSLNAGVVSLTLIGLTPDVAAERSGEYRVSDFDVHLGSGNITNIGTPDDTLIDTEKLTKQLQALHVRLAPAGH